MALIISDGDHPKAVAGPAIAHNIRSGLCSCLDVDVCGGQGTGYGVISGNGADKDNRQLADNAVEVGVGDEYRIDSCHGPFIGADLGKADVAENGIAVAQFNIEVGIAVAGIHYPVAAVAGRKIVAAGVGNLKQLQAAFFCIDQNHGYVLISSKRKGLLQEKGLPAGSIVDGNGVEAVSNLLVVGNVAEHKIGGVGYAVDAEIYRNGIGGCIDKTNLAVAGVSGEEASGTEAAGAPWIDGGGPSGEVGEGGNVNPEVGAAYRPARISRRYIFGGNGKGNAVIVIGVVAVAVSVHITRVSRNSAFRCDRRG